MTSYCLEERRASPEPDTSQLVAVGGWQGRLKVMAAGARSCPVSIPGPYRSALPERTIAPWGDRDRSALTRFSQADVCAWHGSPLGQALTFPGEQGAVSHMAASHIYVMAAACRRSSGLGREPFVKAEGIRVLACQDLPVIHSRYSGIASTA